jgi:hypothetical protein
MAGQTAGQRDDQPEHLVLIHADTGEQLYAGRPTGVTWLAPQRMVVVGGRRYRVAPGRPAETAHGYDPSAGFVRLIRYYVVPEPPPAAS